MTTHLPPRLRNFKPITPSQVAKGYLLGEDDGKKACLLGHAFQFANVGQSRADISKRAYDPKKGSLHYELVSLIEDELFLHNFIKSKDILNPASYVYEANDGKMTKQEIAKVFNTAVARLLKAHKPTSKEEAKKAPKKRALKKKAKKALSKIEGPFTESSVSTLVSSLQKSKVPQSQHA